MPKVLLKAKRIEVADARRTLALKQVVDADHDVADVGEEVADALAKDRREHVVGTRDRRQDHLVEPLVEGVHTAIEALDRVTRMGGLLRRRGTAGERRSRQHGDSESGGVLHV
jgi:hypothetical protein